MGAAELETVRASIEWENTHFGFFGLSSFEEGAGENVVVDEHFVVVDNAIVDEFFVNGARVIVNALGKEIFLGSSQKHD